MKAKALILGVASIFTFMAPFTVNPNKAQALLGSDACKNVTFAIDNNVTQNGKPIAITVKSIDLWSVEEGRWLSENFKNKQVPASRQGYTVRSGESVEYGEGDRMTQIKVHFKAKFYGKWHHFVTTDTSVKYPKCVAGKKYNATVNGSL